jgi:hypothetical protein
MPSFGPSFLNFYDGPLKNVYFGKLLLSIETEEISDKLVSSPQPKQDILMPVNESDYWVEEIFKINLVLVSLDALDLQQSRFKVYMTCENLSSNTVDFEAKEYDGKLKLKFVQFDSNVRPILSLNIKLPDNRIKYQMRNLIQMLVDKMVRKF